MKIDLREIPTCIIASPKDEPARYKSAIAMAQQLGLNYEVHRAVYPGDKILGCLLSQWRVLRQAQAPCLILEDDCQPMPAFRHHFEVPDEADMVSLGVSTYGIPLSDNPPEELTRILHGQRPDKPWKIPKSIAGATVATEYNETFLRVHNMLASHAYLYLTKEAVECAHDQALELMTIPWHYDYALAWLQKRRLVLTPRQPFFYQTSKQAPMTYLEAGLTPVTNLNELDDAWFLAQRSTGKSARALFPRIIQYLKIKGVRRPLEWMLKKGS